MTIEDLRQLVKLGIDALNKSGKGISLTLSAVEKENEEEGTITFTALYDVPNSTKIEKILMSFHTAPLSEFDMDKDGIAIGKNIISRLYSEVKAWQDKYELDELVSLLDGSN